MKAYSLALRTQVVNAVGWQRGGKRKWRPVWGPWYGHQETVAPTAEDGQSRPQAAR